MILQINVLLLIASIRMHSVIDNARNSRPHKNKNLIPATSAANINPDQMTFLTIFTNIEAGTNIRTRN